MINRFLYSYKDRSMLNSYKENTHTVYVIMAASAIASIIIPIGKMMNPIHPVSAIFFDKLDFSTKDFCAG